MSIVTHRKPTKRKLGLLPILGLLFAALLMGVAYGLSPLALKGLASVNEEWDQKLRAQDNPATLPDESQDYDVRYRYLLMGVIWLAVMGISATVAAAAVGKNPEKKALKQMRPSPANRKAMVKELKRELKLAEQRAKQQRKQKGK